MLSRPFIALLVCNFMVYACGTAVVGLLPVYLGRLGADSTTAGLFMAFIYTALAISTILGGRLSDRLQNRKALLILAGVLSSPIAWLMSATTDLIPLMLVLACQWLMTGTIITMVQILGGLYSEEGQRGRLFGLIGLSVNLGILAGALASGPIVDRWGYPTLFMLMAAAYLVVPLAGLLIKDRPVVHAQGTNAGGSLRAILTHRTFLFLCLSVTLVQVANTLLVLARPLVMDTLRFDATAITTAAGIGTLIATPLPLFIGPLSDRLGRKPILVFGFLTTTLALLMLAFAAEPWHFWAVSGLQTVLGASMVVAAALITDLFPRETLGTSLALLQSTPWIGFVIGFGAGGAAISAFGMTTTFWLCVVLSLLALGLLAPVREPRMERETA